MYQKLKMWYARNFQVIEINTARTWYLTWIRNIYGDEINHLGCRSIYEDSKGRKYRVDEVYDNKSRTDINKYGEKVRIYSNGFEVRIK